MEDVELEIQQIVAKTIEMVQNYDISFSNSDDTGKPLQLLWQPSSMRGSSGVLVVDNKENLR